MEADYTAAGRKVGLRAAAERQEADYTAAGRTADLRAAAERSLSDPLGTEPRRSAEEPDRTGGAEDSARADIRIWDIPGCFRRQSRSLCIS